MSCFFCRSKFHISVNCDIYVSDQERKRIALSKIYCKKCFTFYGFKHLFTEKCKIKRKCYICFSKNHHTYLCPERFLIPPFFLPNIDQQLFYRFFDILDPLERYSLACSNPNALNMPQKKSLRIVEICDNTVELEEETNSVTIIISQIFYFRHTNYIINQKLLDSMLLKKLIVKARMIKLANAQFRSHEFFLFISIHIKILEMRNLTIKPEVTFAQILEKIPNIKELEILGTNVKIDEFWPEILLQYKRENDFKRLKILIEDLNFNIENFVKFIKTKCVPSAFFNLHLSYTNKRLKLTNFEEDITNHFAQFFVRDKYQRPRLCISAVKDSIIPICDIYYRLLS